MANNRWDFSDILLQQRAGQIMGQAYAGAGQQAGDVFKQMGEQTKQNSIMEGKVKSSAGFLKSGVDMLQRQADDETKKTGRISEQTAQLLNQAQSSWQQLNDPSIGLYQRHAIAENSANNIINIMHLGSSVMQNNLAQQQLINARFDYARNVNQANAFARLTGQPSYINENAPVNQYASPEIKQSLAPQAPQAPQSVPNATSQYSGQPQAVQPATPPMVPGGGMLRTDAPTPQASNLSQYATSQVPSGVGSKALGIASFGGGSGFNRVIPHLVSSIKDFAMLTGTMLPEAVQTKIAETAMGVKIPVGYINAGQEDVNGQWYTTYKPVYKKSDGSSEISDTGIVKQFSDANFTAGPLVKIGVGSEIIPDTPQKTDPTKIRYTKEQRDGLTEMTGDLQVVNAAGEDLKNAILANRKLNEARISRFAGITGYMNPIMNVLGDTTGSNFDSISSKFVGILMGGEKGGGIKNIRNLQEFKAVTDSIPTSQKPEDIRRDRLNEAAVKYTLSKKRLESTINYLKLGLTEAEARVKANEEVKQLGIEDSIKEIVGSLAGKPSTEGQQIAKRVSGVVGGIPFVGKKMAAAVERTAADNPNVKTPSGWSFNP